MGTRHRPKKTGLWRGKDVERGIGNHSIWDLARLLLGGLGLWISGCGKKRLNFNLKYYLTKCILLCNKIN